MTYKVSAIIPPNRKEIYEIQEVTGDSIRQIAKKERWIVLMVMCDDGTYHVYRYDATPLFYDHTVKRWISKEEYRKRKHELL